MPNDIQKARTEFHRSMTYYLVAKDDGSSRRFFSDTDVAIYLSAEAVQKLKTYLTGKNFIKAIENNSLAKWVDDYMALAYDLIFDEQANLKPEIITKIKEVFFGQPEDAKRVYSFTDQGQIKYDNNERSLKAEIYLSTMLGASITILNASLDMAYQAKLTELNDEIMKKAGIPRGTVKKAESKDLFPIIRAHITKVKNPALAQMQTALKNGLDEIDSLKTRLESAKVNIKNRRRTLNELPAAMKKLYDNVTQQINKINSGDVVSPIAVERLTNSYNKLKEATDNIIHGQVGELFSPVNAHAEMQQDLSKLAHKVNALVGAIVNFFRSLAGKPTTTYTPRLFKSATEVTLTKVVTALDKASSVVTSPAAAQTEVVRPSKGASRV